MSMQFMNKFFLCSLGIKRHKREKSGNLLLKDDLIYQHIRKSKWGDFYMKRFDLAENERLIRHQREDIPKIIIRF